VGQGITNRGTMRAGGYLGLASKGNVTNDRGLIKSGGNLQIQALSGAFRNFGGQVDAGGTAQFKVATFHNGINTSGSTTTRKIIRIGAQEYDYDTMVAEAQAAFGGKYTLDWHFLSFGGYDDPNHLLPLYVYLRENYGAIIPLFVMPGRLSLDVDMGVMARLHGDNMPRHALPEGNAHKVTATFSEGVIAQVFDNTNTQIVEVSGTYFDESQTDAGQSLIRSGGAMQVDAGRVTNLYGVLSSGGAMTINAAADVTNSQARYQEKRSAFAVHTHRAKHKGRYHTRVSADRVHRAESKSVAGDRTGFVANGAISINAPGGFHNGGDLDSTGSKLLGELGAGGLIPTTGAATSTTLSADLSQAGQAGQPMKDDIDLTAVAPQAPVLRRVSLTFKDSAGQQAAISALVTSQLAQAQGEQTVLAAQIAAVVPDSFEQLQQSGTKIRNASLTFPNLRDTGSLLDLIRDGQTTIAETNPEFRQLSNFLTSNFLMDVDRLQYRDELVNNTVEPHLSAVLRAPVPQPDAGQFALFGQTLADSAPPLG
jgi:adhesin HecA-like repeat protein